MSSSSSQAAEQLLARSPEPLHLPLSKNMDALGLPFEKLHFDLLPGGFSNSWLYTFSYQGKSYVLRFLDPRQPDNEERRAKRLNEILAQRRAAELGLAPEIFCSDVDGQICVMDFVEGKALSNKDLESADFLRLYAQSIARLHAASIEGIRHRPQLERVRKHHRRTLEKGGALPSCYSSLYQAYEEEELSLVGQEVFCHGDLHSANILLRQGSPVFIDWTGATTDSLYNDLGYAAMLQGLSSPLRQLFMSAYLGHEASQEEMDSLAAAERRSFFVTATIWFEFSEDSARREGPMEERVQALDHELSSGNLQSTRGRCPPPPLSAPSHEVRSFALSALKDFMEES